MKRRITALAAAALLAATAPLLSACATPPVGTPEMATEAGEPAEAGLMLGEGWAKAGEAGGMTGVFGTLMNGSRHDIVITGVESDAAGMIELHEVTAEGVMQEIEGEVVVPAGGSFELAPGANHIMLMDLTGALLAGDEVSFTIRYTSDGVESSEDFTVLVKDYAGANESYDDGEHGSGGHDSGEHEGH